MRRNESFSECETLWKRPPCREVAMEKLIAAQTASYSCGGHSGAGSGGGGVLWAQQLWVCMDLVGLLEHSWQPVRRAGEVWARLLQPLGKHREGLPDPFCVARLKLYLSTLFTSVRLIWCCWGVRAGWVGGGGLLLDSEDRLSSPKCRSEAGPKTVW